MVAHPPFDKSGVSGTVLNQFILERNVKEWARLSFSSVYYVLNHLEKKGFIRAKEQKMKKIKEGAPQKLFIVTLEGKRILKKTVIEYFKRMNLNYKEMNLALAAAYMLTDTEFLKLLRVHRKKMEERMNKVQFRYGEDRNGMKEEELPVHVWALFNYAFYALTARKEFLDELISKLERKMELSERIKGG
jgi:DNA-binding PadR family transcriptional regulator